MWTKFVEDWAERQKKKRNKKTKWTNARIQNLTLRFMLNFFPLCYNCCHNVVSYADLSVQAPFRHWWIQGTVHADWLTTWRQCIWWRSLRSPVDWSSAQLSYCYLFDVTCFILEYVGVDCLFASLYFSPVFLSWGGKLLSFGLTLFSR